MHVSELGMVALLVLLVSLVPAVAESARPPDDLRPPVAEGIWLRPAAEWPAAPVIGLRDGIRISLWPVPSPRGLISILAPYAFPPDVKIPRVNFVAVEPIVGGKRGYSEMEKSDLDATQGRRLWFSDELSNAPKPALPWHPTRGRIGRIRVGDADVETLSVVVNVEPMTNGARPQVLVTFRADRPNEVSLRTYAAKDSAPMEQCVLTATMGNFCRNRLLWLKDEVVDSRTLWPDYRGDGFVGTPDFGRGRMRREKDGALIVAITPNETDLQAVEMPPGGWWCAAKVTTQYWRKPAGTARADLKVRVNGRAMYWAGQTLIPGGVSFENFELIQRYSAGDEFVFGVTLRTAKEMGW